MFLPDLLFSQSTRQRLTLSIIRRFVLGLEIRFVLLPQTRDMTEVHVIGGNLAYPGKAPDPARYPFTTAKCGRANVSLTFLGFVKIWRGTGEVFDMVDLFLPPVKYTTQVGDSLIALVPPCFG